MRAALLIGTLFAFALSNVAAAADAPKSFTATPSDSAPHIPFVVGLTTVRAVSEPRGDYESLRVIEAIQPDRYRIALSGEVPRDDGSGLMDIRVVREVRKEDQANARRIRGYFHTGDAKTFTGTVPGFSATMVNELRATGSTRLTFLDIGTVFGMSVVKRELSGSIARAGGAGTTMSMLVNGRRVLLPVIRAKGKLADDGAGESFEIDVLDDPANPIVLGLRGAGISTSLIKIEYPEPKNVEHVIERQLASARMAEVYGIYFAFDRADIRPQSERVLAEIADTLKKHPDWRLRIDGHTDSIGEDANNLVLSRRRAEAVRNALIKSYAITADRLSTGGYGETRPKATNNTMEGRALNRRVELTRL